MATILAVGNTKAESSPFTLSAGDVVSLALIPGATGVFAGGSVAVAIEYEVDSKWVPHGELRAVPIDDRLKVLQAPGTYRVARAAQDHEAGVDKTP